MAMRALGFEPKKVAELGQTFSDGFRGWFCWEFLGITRV